MILAAAIAVHFITWREAPGQIGVAIGEGLEARLLVMIPAAGCGAGMQVYSGRYGENEAAIRMIQKSRICAVKPKP